MATTKTDVYLEAGKKKVMACAVDWRGWCRSGRDEQQALEALLESAPRYASILKAAGIAFRQPQSLNDLHVVERLEGDSGTDFGLPSLTPPHDEGAFSEQDVKPLQALLDAYWTAFGQAVEAARGKELAKGPRGGGRELEKIVEHVRDAEGGYANRLAWKGEQYQGDDLLGSLEHAHEQARKALARAAEVELPKQGPRGGKIWTPRYFVRRTGWHVLDHVWEIEDRSM